jgi:hypothetical protein
MAGKRLTSIDEKRCSLAGTGHGRIVAAARQLSGLSLGTGLNQNVSHCFRKIWISAPNL